MRMPSDLSMLASRIAYTLSRLYSVEININPPIPLRQVIRPVALENNVLFKDPGRPQCRGRGGNALKFADRSQKPDCEAVD